MRKLLCAFLSAAMLLTLAACGAGKQEAPAPEEQTFVWTREGYFADAENNLVYIAASQDAENPGWMVSCMMTDAMHGWYIQQEGSTLHGNIVAPYETGEEPFVVTVTEEGEDGIQLVIEGGATYHLSPYEIPEAAFTVSVNTEGSGQIAYAEEGDALEWDDEFPSQSAYIGLEDVKTYTFGAKPDEGWKFMRWTANGETVSKEPEITLEITEDTELVAVFGIAGTDETPVDLESVTTLGQLFGLPNYGTSYGNGRYVYAFEQDGDIYRAVAELPEATAETLFALDWEDPEHEAKERAIAAELTVTSIVNLTAGMPTQAELDALIGKTGEELFNDGWYCQGWNAEDGIFYMAHEAYGYEMTMEGEALDFDSLEDEDIKPLVVTGVRCTGVNDPSYVEEE